MIEATKWGAKAILTDRTDDWLALKHEMLTDWEKVAKETSWKFGFTSFRYTFFHNVSRSFQSSSPLSARTDLNLDAQFLAASWEAYVLTKTAGQFIAPPPSPKILPTESSIVIPALA